MKEIYLDTETTGLSPGRMFQLAYIITGKNPKGKNFFFSLPDNTMSFEALQEHGITERRTRELADGKIFLDHYEEIKADFEGSKLIAHNMEFDKAFILNELRIAGLPEFKDTQYRCTMKYFTPIFKLPAVKPEHEYKYPKLKELIKEYKVQNIQALRVARILFDCRNEKIGFHDARFDVSMLYLCCEAYLTLRELGYEQS